MHVWFTFILPRKGPYQCGILHAEMQQSGVKINCSALEDKLKQLKEYHESSSAVNGADQTLNVGFTSMLVPKESLEILKGGFSNAAQKPKLEGSRKPTESTAKKTRDSSLGSHPVKDQPSTSVIPSRIGVVKPQGKPRNWASLLQSQGPAHELKLEFFPDLHEGKHVAVEIDEELVDDGNWNNYLMGYLKYCISLTVRCPTNFLITLLMNTGETRVSVKPDVSGFTLFQFRDETSKCAVLENGPCFFSQKFLVLKNWHRTMKPVKEQPSKIPAWVKIYYLPFELWNKECLSRIASTIGRPIHVDQATAKKSKSSSARICIKIDVNLELLEDVAITVAGETVVVSVEYQVLPPICEFCKVFGYTSHQCSKSSVAKPKPVVTEVWQQVGKGRNKVVPIPNIVEASSVNQEGELTELSLVGGPSAITSIGSSEASVNDIIITNVEKAGSMLCTLPVKNHDPGDPSLLLIQKKTLYGGGS
ncbi:uncharacterized protein LOC131301486 isoform X2 [Rhododendron vialii]|uniref:uncharacterized protein LOC131301486 isoform X2 n=1 Tax=Rhododendron vialii TaxID=182163 RepID=UPI002660272A|nr:uncharacterized protein LOC131301486 isoform X2 [Rhododendron vialii]